MLDLSDSFTTFAKATVRDPRAKIEIAWTDPMIDTTITVSTTDDNRGAILTQVADIATDVPYKWAHLGSNFVLGSARLAPSSSDAAPSQVGWWGTTFSNGAKLFPVAPTLTVEFDARPVWGLLVSGDNAYNEHPVDFEIVVYDSSDTVLHTETVTDNSSLVWSTDISGVTDATKMVLTVSKWSKPNAVVKITEFYTSIVSTYYTDDITSINLLEESEIRDSSIPIGNMSCNDVDISLQNIEVNGVAYPFTPDNVASPYYALVKKNRRIKVWFGFNSTKLSWVDRGVQDSISLVGGGSDIQDSTILGVDYQDTLVHKDTEWAPMGTFWTDDWTIANNNSVINTMARDRLSVLQDARYPGSKVYESTTLYDLAEILVEHAIENIPMRDLVYSIDADLAGYTIEYGYIPPCTYFEGIRQIVTACMGVAYMTRGDVLMITGQSA